MGLSQWLTGWPLYAFSGAALLLALALAWATAVRILRRIRYVALALVILFAWQTPGVLVLPALGALSPTYDGLRIAAEPAARLFAVAGVVALLLHWLSAEDWLNSLYALAQPFRIFGLSPQRCAVRLRLVLDFVDARTVDWQHLLREDPAEVAPNMAWTMRPMAWPDRACVAALGLIFVLLWVIG